jgi:hypothetical protein
MNPLIPQELQNETRWVAWREEKRNGKKTKVPYDAKTGDFAKSNDSTTWAPYAQAAEAAAPLNKDNYDGVGFMLHGSNFTGIDFDGVVDDGVPQPYVLNILSQIGDPYCEVTPSGTGLRVFIKGSKLPPGNRKFSAKKKGVEKYGAEIYAGSEGGRYLTITGERYSGEGIPQIENIDIVYFQISKFADEYFRRLWMGDSSEYENDESRVDLALLGLLAREFNGEVPKMLRFFDASVPGHREKWVEREDYRNLTLNKALDGFSKSGGSPPRELRFHLPATKGGNFDYVINPMPDKPYDDGWFPLGSPSLIGGLSGSNKSTWMMQQLLAQVDREPFLGHTTNGRPYLILMADRGEGSHQRTMRRMRLEDKNIPIKFISPKTGLDGLQEFIDKIEETSPLPEVVFIEGLDTFVDDGCKKQIVAPFMTALQKIATHYHLAIIGSVGAPKSKAGEGYIAKRDNISGTEAWSRMAETVVLLQYPKGKDTVAERELTVLPRNAASESFALTMKHGRLELQTEEDRRRAEGRDQEIQWAQKQARLAKDDATKKWWTVLDMMRELDLPKSNVYRWVQDACAKDYITEKPGKKGRSKAAQFRWNESKTNPLWVEEDENAMAL